MNMSDRTNVSAIDLFNRSLDQYELALETSKLNNRVHSGPAQYLQQSMNRMITSTIPDAHEMMRSLAERMLSGSDSYSEKTILTLASGSTNTMLRDEIMAIPFTLLSVIKGEDPVLDNQWLSRVNGNLGIFIFLKNYKDGDMDKIHRADMRNINAVSLPYEKRFSEEDLIVVEIGSKAVDLTLNSRNIQTINLIKGENLTPPVDHNTDESVIYGAYLTVRTQTKQFRMSKSVKISNAVKEIIAHMGCLDNSSVVSNYYQFKTPAPFFSFQFDIVSFDSGLTWTIVNLRIVPPELYK